jgi:hypothetical protein
MQRSADTTALIFGKGPSRPLMPGVMLLMNLVDQINSHRYLYLDRLYEDRDLELCVIVNEAKILGGELESFDNATAYGPIVSDDTCIKYKITFKNYVAYCVTNETYAGAGDDEEFTGTLFRTYSKSQFLDYVTASGGGLIETLDGYTHYEVVTLNQIVDVASTREPEIQIVPAADAT